jgi:hypothetical protein
VSHKAIVEDLHKEVIELCVLYKKGVLVGGAFDRALSSAITKHEQRYDQERAAMGLDPCPSLRRAVLLRVEDTIGVHYCEANTMCTRSCRLVSCNPKPRNGGRFPFTLPTDQPKTKSRTLGATLKSARHAVNSKIRIHVFMRDGHKCKLCGSGAPLEVDHVIPVSKGGSSDLENLQSLCIPCNRRKGAKIYNGMMAA